MPNRITEVRYVTTELRAKKDKVGMEGYAAVFNKDSVDLGGFVERIIPGAFSRAIKEKQDVRALINHNADKVLGRTKNGTLHLSEDDKGLRMDNDFPDTQDAKDVAKLIDRGDIDQCSFKFSVVRQKWGEEPDPADPTKKATRFFRELHDVDLYDVSAVTFPAYPDTSVNLRALLWPNGIPDEVRTHLSGLEVKKKKVGGLELTRSCFAYVGDSDDPRTWKLPIDAPGDAKKTREFIDAAIKRFVAAIVPTGSRLEAWRTIRAAAKKFEVTVSDEDRDKALRAMDPESCECDCDACTAGNHDKCMADDPASLHDGDPDDEENSVVTGEEVERMRMRLKLESMS